MANAFSSGWPARLPKPGKQPLSKQLRSAANQLVLLKNASTVINRFEHWAD